MKNSLGRDIPEYIEGYGKVKLFNGAFNNLGIKTKRSVDFKCVSPYDEKLVSSIHEVLLKCEIKDGMTISFHLI